MASETPLSIGVSVDQLWDLLQPRHVGLVWGSPPTESEAVLVALRQEVGIFFLPAYMVPGAPSIELRAQGEDGTEDGTLLAGAYLALET